MAAEAQPALAKKIIYLKPLVVNSADCKQPQERCADEAQSPVNPNIETAYKPFTEKLAMFRKADTEEEIVNVDPEKCK